jgi:penicillin-binding protein 2
MELRRHITFRLKYMSMLICFVFMAIIGHLFRMQIILTSNFFSLGKKNCLRIEKIPSPRGNITDAQGNLLATNKSVYTIFWQGTGNKQLTANQQALYENLATIINVDSTTLPALTSSEKQGKRLLLQEDIQFEQLSRIIEKFPNHPNIAVAQHFKRFYPHNALASHMIGYLGCLDMEPIGRMGIEMLFENTLKGHPGELAQTVNSVGKHLAEQEIKKALSGGTIATTLNLDLQKIAEDVFPLNEAGTCIILDPKTGAIETLLSRPTFDPNIFLNTISSQDWQHLQEKQCFVNRALNACYPPASVFKIVTLSAALETHVIDLNTTWYCNGHITFADRVIQCSKHEGHGSLMAQQALAQSCNIPFYEIGKKMKIDTLASYAHKFGLGEKTTILFPEKEGLIPTSSWKRRVKKSAWWPGETLSACIGQSYLLVTPMQVACMMSAIFEGYLVRPRILTAEEIVTKPLDLAPSTITFLKNSLRQVIRGKGGTGRRLTVLQDVEIYAKTGTAQTSDLAKRDWGKKYVEHGWFVGYFKYKNHKPLTIVILLENVGSAQVSTQLALELLKRYCAHLEKQEIIFPAA